MVKYVLFVPMGGLNDMLGVIQDTIDYCNRYGRVLLLHTLPCEYNINFSDYFEINNKNVICDSNEIKQILINNELTVYPTILKKDLLNIFNCNCSSTIPVKDGKGYEYVTRKNQLCYEKGGSFSYHESTPLVLPIHNPKEDVIIHSRCRNGEYQHKAEQLFRSLEFTEKLKNWCKSKINVLPDNYICIQVRHTDNVSDYKKLYSDNKLKIESSSNVYVATDNKSVLEYFKDKRDDIINFTTYPEVRGKNLHNDTTIEPEVRICECITDIMVATNSKEILSNSSGGYILLMRHCFQNKKDILSKLD